MGEQAAGASDWTDCSLGQKERFGDVKCDRVPSSLGSSGSADTSTYLLQLLFLVLEKQLTILI